MQTGHIKCYFSPTNKLDVSDLTGSELALQLLALVSKGWKVALEVENGKTFIYWGA